jgi:hypothetical protein
MHCGDLDDSAGIGMVSSRSTGHAQTVSATGIYAAAGGKSIINPRVSLKVYGKVVDAETGFLPGPLYQ